MQADECPYRIYRRRGREPELIATAPDMESVGVAVCTLGGEDELEDAALGIMFRPEPEKPGTWLANPWAPGITHPRDTRRKQRRRS